MVARNMVGTSSKTFQLSVLLVITFLNLFQPSFTQNLKFKSLDALKHSLDTKQSDNEPLTLLWGIADTTAYVGKLFTYALPNDAFQGNVVHYNVTKAGEKTLPAWLSFNSLKTELKGIPRPQDKGQTYLEVKAVGDDNSKADDVFSVEVIEDSSMSVGASKLSGENTPKHVRCRREEPETISTVILDVDLHSLNPSESIAIFNNLASHLNLAPEMLKLMPVGDKPMFDTTALVAGPGDTRSPKSQGALVSWLVGCGKVESDHLPALQQLETSAANGDMGSALGYGIVGWHVTNSRFQQKVRRKRAATATPTMTMPAPTKVTDMSSASIKPTMSSSMPIQPTKTVEVQPTSVVVQPSSSVSMETSTISPSSTVKMTKTMDPTPEPTEVLPSKTFTMTETTSSSTASTKPTPKQTTTQSTKKPKPTTTSKPTPVPVCPPSGRGIKKAPMVEKHIKNFTIMAGDVLRYKIPEDTFFDCYDDKTSDLDLELLLDNENEVPSEFWMQIKKKLFKPYRLIANPLSIHSKNYKLILRAENFYGMSADQEFFVDVLGEEMTPAAPSHEMSMTIDIDYDEFMSDLDNRLAFTNKLASLYGDSNSESITITRIDRGSVIIAWTNRTLPSDSCPVGDIENLVNKLFNKDDSLSDEAINAMKPYKISSAASVPLGKCTNNPNFPKRDTKKAAVTTAPTVKPVPETTMKQVTPKKTMKTTETPATLKPETTVKVEKTTQSMSSTTEIKVAAAGAGGGSDIWITTVVPAIVVVVVLIIALVIACCLYRKKRKGKMKLEEQNSFNKKGVPVIFADEYEDRPNDSIKPLILRDEKPPMPPPEYQRASSEGSAGSNSTNPIEEAIEMDDKTDETSPLYQPPPPVTASSSNKPPPPHLQASRNPPPYVPP